VRGPDGTARTPSARRLRRSLRAAGRRAQPVEDRQRLALGGLVAVLSAIACS
jgi:hypothetical protein